MKNKKNPKNDKFFAIGTALFFLVLFAIIKTSCAAL
tara:strand:+ start:126 stop:233 length:108 start_codon:yes stop_codon:yes gene_type:complete